MRKALMNYELIRKNIFLTIICLILSILIYVIMNELILLSLSFYILYNLTLFFVFYYYFNISLSFIYL